MNSNLKKKVIKKKTKGLFHSHQENLGIQQANVYKFLVCIIYMNGQMKWKGVGIEADKTKLTLMIILKRMTT